MKCLFAAALLALFVAPPAEAQIRAKAKQGIINQKQLKQQKQADAIERFLVMSPAERRRALAQLPPARQRQLLRLLAQLDLLSDEERNLLRGRMQAFSSLPADRQPAVRAELRNLRGMSREDRRRRLGSDEVKQNFSEDERQLLYDVFGQAAQREE